ncbi:MAG: response regulator transcription factor [Gemmatimonadales bacterium]|nr:response regulator transcription factor [Gemmatimonadales bacterium]
MTEPITVVIAEDHPVFRQGLTEVLGADGTFRIVGQAGDGEAALDLVRRLRPRIALLDVDMPKASGLVVAEAIGREELGAAVVILTMYKDARMFRRALDIGARGYVLKDSAATEIVACLHMVASGRAYISAALSSELLDRRAAAPLSELGALAELTAAERRVLRFIAQDRTSTGIAQELGISPKTVENHRSHICRKLGLHGPQALLRFALGHKSLLE